MKILVKKKKLKKGKRKKAILFRKGLYYKFTFVMSQRSIYILKLKIIFESLMTTP